VIESTSLIAVEAAFNSSDNSSTGSMNDRVSTVANHLFQLVYPIGFVNASSADTLVSRAGCEEHPIVKWTDCILATPLPDRVSFLIHKKDPRQASRPRNLSLWFDDDFRRR
jgi:hypothetical protein